MYALPSKHMHYYIYAIFASLMAYCPSPVGQHERSLARPLASRTAIFPFCILGEMSRARTRPEAAFAGSGIPTRRVGPAHVPLTLCCLKSERLSTDDGALTKAPSHATCQSVFALPGCCIWCDRVHGSLLEHSSSCNLVGSGQVVRP